MPKFVCPIPVWLRSQLLDYDRLYAYPNIPEINDVDLIILDSGAFALSFKKREMDLSYLEDLSYFYNKWYQYNVKCVAPDKFLDFKKTMKNFISWHNIGLFKDVCPVLQSDKKHNLDKRIFYYQLDFYKEFYKGNLDFIFFSNPACRANEYPINFFKDLKEKYGIRWIHNLGAAWDKKDILNWSNFKGLDSLDTIAYYISTNELSGNWNNIKGNKIEISISNVNFAIKYLNNNEI